MQLDASNFRFGNAAKTKSDRNKQKARTVRTVRMPIKVVSKIRLEREYMVENNSQVFRLRYIVKVFRQASAHTLHALAHVIHAENLIQNGHFGSSDTDGSSDSHNFGEWVFRTHAKWIVMPPKCIVRLFLFYLLSILAGVSMRTHHKTKNITMPMTSSFRIDTKKNPSYFRHPHLYSHFVCLDNRRAIGFEWVFLFALHSFRIFCWSSSSHQRHWIYFYQLCKCLPSNCRLGICECEKNRYTGTSATRIDSQVICCRMFTVQHMC